MQFAQFRSGFGVLLLLRFLGVVGQFIVVAFPVAAGLGPVAARRRGAEHPAGSAAAEFMPHRYVDHDRAVMWSHAQMTGNQMAGNVVRARMAGVLAAAVMLAVLTVSFVTTMRAWAAMSVVMACFAVATMLAMFTMLAVLTSRMLTPAFAMTFAMTFAVPRVAVMLVAAMGIALMATAALMLAIPMFSAMPVVLSIVLGMAARFGMPLPVPFAIATVAALVIVVFVFIVMALAIVVAQREQLDAKISALVLHGDGRIGGGDFAGQGSVDSQPEMVQQIGRANSRCRLLQSDWLFQIDGLFGRRLCPAADAADKGEGGQSRKD